MVILEPLYIPALVTLLFETFGAISAALLVRVALTRSSSLLPALACIAIVIGAVTFWSDVWPEARSLVRLHRADGHLTRAQAFAEPGQAFGADEPFLAWAARELPPRARVFLECPQPKPCSYGLPNWITYRLAPRVFTDYPTEAQWVLFYGTPTRALSSATFTVVARYAPGYVVGRLP
jgi:hypothetical protein